MSYIGIMSEIAVLVLYIFIGYILRKIRLITENGINDISKLVVNLAMPLLVIKAMNIEYKPEYVRNIFYVAASALAFIVFTYLTGNKVVGFARAEEAQKKAMRFCMIFGNAAFLGYPLCYALFGDIGMFYASIFVVMQNVFLWTAGVNIYKQEKIRLSNLKRLINPGTIAISIGLTLFFLNIRPPMIIERVMDGIGGITIPLALMMTGATLYGYKFVEIVTDKKVLLVAIVKTIAFPVVFLAVLYFIPMDGMLKSTLTIQAAAPVQASAAVYAKNFKGDSVIAAKSTFLSTLLCLITIPLFLVLVNL